MSSTLWELLTSPLERDDSVWELFHENSKASPSEPFLPEAAMGPYLRQMPESLDFEGYPLVKLPETVGLAPVLLGDALRDSSSVNELEPSPITLDQAAALLQYSYGCADGEDADQATRRRRSVHSAGALYPLEIFVHSARVRGLEPGIYHYSPPGNSWRLLRPGDQSQRLAPGFEDGRVAQTAALMVFIAAMPERAVLRYGDRGYRFAMLEAGAVAQNLNLVARASGLACLNIGEYFDREIDEVLSLDGLTLSTMYVVGIGNPGGSKEGAAGGRPSGRVVSVNHN